MGQIRKILLAGLVPLGAALLSGCPSESPVVKRAATSFRGVALSVGALDDRGILTGVAPLRGEWVASREGEIRLAEEPVTLDTVEAVDVLLFPAHRLGDLVDARALATLPDEMVLPPRPVESEAENQSNEQGSGHLARVRNEDAGSFVYADIAPAYRDLVTRYGSERLALPCGGSALVLVYRRDAFEQPTNVAAARQRGLVLEPPATWAQLDELAKFFHGRDWNGEEGPDRGIALALGPDTEGVADATFLARAASLGQHRDHYSLLFDSDSMTPRIDSPPFVEALAGLVALRQFGPPGAEQFDARAARAAFRTGRVAMLVDLAEQAAGWSHRKPIGAAPLGVAPLPGSERVFEPVMKSWQTCSPPNAPSCLPRGGGWLVGINRRLSGTALEAAVDFVKYLTNSENLNRLRAEPSFPMLPVRASQMGLGLPDPTSAPDVDSQKWSEAVRRTLMADRVVPGLRIPQTAAYLADLARGREAALRGESSQKALQGVAQAWAKRTAELGPKHQLWHYRRSLNTLATLPGPPELGK
jgi:multiple sugar transport system substrate-binding protein